MRAMIVLIGRIALLAATVAGVVAAIVWTVRGSNQWLALGLPLVIAGGAILIVRTGYRALRELRWRERKRREAAASAALRIPDEVRKPAAFDGVDVIDAAEHAVLRTVPNYQGAMYLRGITVAFLPPLAVLLAAIPSVAAEDWRLAIGASIAEAVALLAVVGIVHLSLKPARRWVAARTWGELLRREQYLRLAHVGPYLNLDHHAAVTRTQERLAILDPKDDTGRAEAIAMRDDPEGRRWIDQLWTTPHPSPPDQRERALSYLHYRIRKQIMWFQLGAENAERSDRQISAIIKGSLGLAVAIVAAQAVLRLPWLEGTDRAAEIATLFALVLPSVSAFLLALRQLYAYRGLVASYTHMVNDLTDERRALERLIIRMADLAADQEALGLQFQATVLHTEAILTDELQRWIMIIDRDQFEFDA